MHRGLLMLAGLLITMAGGVAMGQVPPIDPALLMVRPGNSPIIISAPHGGTLPVPGVAPREGVGVKKFATVRDDGTEVLAPMLAERLEKLTGKKPHLVVALFQRKCVDVNRPAGDAFESDKAKPYYEAYHAALAKARETVTARHGRGLLIDIHGQGADKDAIFRGTNGFKTVTHLFERSGKGALLGKGGLLGELAKRERKIIPANDSDDKEDPRYGGGFIVQTYGSKSGGTVDAVQLELGSKLRRNPGREQFTTDLAESLATFAGNHLPKSLPVKD
ncbi:MAG: hypothetical protein ACKO26_00235 [Planctomycetota bacterium]